MAKKRISKSKTTSRKQQKVVASARFSPSYSAPKVPLKRYLTLDQEFEIMKLVLDKFLWLGFAIMAFGLYICIVSDIRNGLYFILAGVIILLLFVWMVVKEYEVITR